MSDARTWRVVIGMACAAVIALGIAMPAHADTDDDSTDGPHASQDAAPLQGWRIALDPGHNGGNASNPRIVNSKVSDGRGGVKPCNTTGTTTASGYAEHEFTFDVATALTAELEQLGATVLHTREDNDGVGPCIDVRGRFAEDADADIMISLHGNGSILPTAQGFFAIVADPAMSPSQGELSLALAEKLIAALTEAGLTPSNTVDDALSQRDDLATLNFARRPAVMLELGEMRNTEDAALMETSEGHQQYAEAISTGILAWVDALPPPTRAG